MIISLRLGTIRILFIDMPLKKNNSDPSFLFVAYPSRIYCKMKFMLFLVGTFVRGDKCNIILLRRVNPTDSYICFEAKTRIGRVTDLP